ncbi:Uncharacterised protein [Mycobacterium tuberculosis]|nr:Uncharacterised protein [Mycobacterium tuberculosis]
MIVVGGFAPRQHRRNTCVSAGENPRPLVAGSAGKSLGEDVIHLRVAGHIELSRHVSGRQAEPAQQRREELRLDCPNGHVLAVGRFVAAVERGAAVEQERFALVAQAANPLHGPHHLRQHANPVDHRSIDDLTHTRTFPFVEGHHNAQQHQHRAAAEVGNQV